MRDVTCLITSGGAGSPCLIKDCYRKDLLRVVMNRPDSATASGFADRTATYCRRHAREYLEGWFLEPPPSYVEAGSYGKTTLYRRRDVPRAYGPPEDRV